MQFLAVSKAGDKAEKRNEKDAVNNDTLKNSVDIGLIIIALSFKYTKTSSQILLDEMTWSAFSKAKV